MAPDEENADEQQPAMDDGASNGGLYNISGGDPEGGIPAHADSNFKQLHSIRGFNLAVSKDGEIYGAARDDNVDSVLHFSSIVSNEEYYGIRIQGHNAGKFVAMDDDGNLYGEADENSENTVWIQRYNSEQRYNSYVLKKALPDNEYFLGMKKTGNPKNGHKTREGQKAILFLPKTLSPRPE